MKIQLGYHSDIAKNSLIFFDTIDFQTERSNKKFGTDVPWYVSTPSPVLSIKLTNKQQEKLNIPKRITSK